MNILHCDLDAFFASVEQRDRPELRGLPVIVGGQPGGRGVVSTCSYEAREYGVHSAMPISQAVRLCPGAVFLSPDLKKYSQVSAQVFSILSRFTPLVEPLSIDEAFLDVSGCHTLFGDSRAIAEKIKAAVLAEAGLTISVGIAGNKYLAKLATNLCKPNGIMELNHQDADRLLPRLSVSHLWGVGARTTEQLARAGIFTIGDLLKTPYPELERLLGSSTPFLLSLARGDDQRQVVPEHQAKSVGNEITFSADISNQESLEQVILELSCKVGFRLRQMGFKARTISLKLRRADFRTLQRSQTPGAPIDGDLDLFAIARELYRESGLLNIPLRLVGVNCSNLVPREDCQPGLFEDENNQLDQLMDHLRLRFSSRIITRGGLLKEPEEKM